jgi:hypothetical protein
MNYAKRHRTAVLVFDLEDKFARDRRLHGPHPRPFGPISFYLLGRPAANGGQPQYFEERWKMVMQRNPSGYYLFSDVVRLPDGRKWQARLPAGEYLVRVESLYYRPEQAAIELPGPQDPGEEIDVEQINFPSMFFDLLPGYAYPFPQLNGVPGPQSPTLLRGSIPRITGLDVVGIEVSAEKDVDEDKRKYLTYRTDEAGQWVLVFPKAESEEDVALSFTLPSGASTTVEQITIKPGWQNTMNPDKRKELKDKLKEVLPPPG